MEVKGWGALIVVLLARMARAAIRAIRDNHNDKKVDDYDHHGNADEIVDTN